MASFYTTTRARKHCSPTSLPTSTNRPNSVLRNRSAVVASEEALASHRAVLVPLRNACPRWSACSTPRSRPDVRGWWRAIHTNRVRTISRHRRARHVVSPRPRPVIAASALSSMIEHFCYVWHFQGPDDRRRTSDDHAIETLWTLWARDLLARDDHDGDRHRRVSFTTDTATTLPALLLAQAAAPESVAMRHRTSASGADHVGRYLGQRARVAYEAARSASAMAPAVHSENRPGGSTRSGHRVDLPWWWASTRPTRLPRCATRCRTPVPRCSSPRTRSRSTRRWRSSTSAPTCGASS